MLLRVFVVQSEDSSNNSKIKHRQYLKNIGKYADERAIMLSCLVLDRGNNTLTERNQRKNSFSTSQIIYEINHIRPAGDK